MTPTALPYGPLAVLFEVDDTASAVALATWIRDEHHSGVVDVVPAARTVVVTCTSEGSRAALEAGIGGFEHRLANAEAGPIVEIPVVYDGLDLDDVALAAGCSTAEVIRLHSEATYTGAFSGFAPGFTYLIGLHPRLHLPRRSTPRPVIPAGSVAIGAEFAGVYPTASPGGWHLLGRTEVRLWDIDRPQPALLVAGTRVRFVPQSLP